MKSRLPTPKLRHALAAMLLVGLLPTAACGSDDEKGTSGEGGSDVAEMAFLTSMAHHHETAIEMAEIAQERAKGPFVKRLAEDIVTTQEKEIERMRSIHQRLFDSKLEPDPMGHEGLGLSAEEAGMTHTPATNKMLRAANPFDRAFVDEMVPHHTGAVRMAKVVLESTKDAELRKLADGIVATQEREIEDMNSFRERTYGAPVPAGGGEHGGGHSG